MKIDKHLSNRTHDVEWSGIRIMFALADEIPGVVNLGIGMPEVIAEIAAERKPTMRKLPYGIPLTIGALMYFAWTGMLL